MFQQLLNDADHNSGNQDDGKSNVNGNVDGNVNNGVMSQESVKSDQSVLEDLQVEVRDEVVIVDKDGNEQQDSNKEMLRLMLPRVHS